MLDVRSSPSVVAVPMEWDWGWVGEGVDRAAEKDKHLFESTAYNMFGLQTHSPTSILGSCTKQPYLESGRPANSDALVLKGD